MAAHMTPYCEKQIADTVTIYTNWFDYAWRTLFSDAETNGGTRDKHRLNGGTRLRSLA